MNDQIRFAGYLINQMEECLDEGCAGDVACLLDNLARAGLRLARDGEMESSQAYMEWVMERNKA